MSDAAEIVEPTGADATLREIWRIKDELSAARSHDVHRLFREARERQKLSDHPIFRLSKRKAAVLAPKKTNG